jgi:virginiamycin B lyase
LFIAATFSAAQSFTEFPVPTPDADIHGMTVGPDGALWFNGLAFGPDGNIWYSDVATGVLGRMTTSGTVTEFHGGSIFDLTIGPDGQLWGAGPGGVARISTSGSIEFSPSTPEAYRTITTGPDGNIWFPISTTKIGRLALAGGLTEFVVPTYAQNSPFDDGAPWPFAVVAGPDGNIWFTEEYGNKIGRVNLRSARVVERPAPERRVPREHSPRD